MTIGIALNKLQIDADTGSVALELARVMRRLDELHEFFLITPDVALTAIGYTEAEVVTLKSAFNNDGALLVSIYRGLGNLPAAQDFRANLNQLYGDGLT